MKTKSLIFLSLFFILGMIHVSYCQDTTSVNAKNGFYREEFGSLKMEGNYADGLKYGVWITYYPTGYINKVEEFHQGKRNGVFIEFDNKGTITSQATYKEDKLDGVNKKYARAGKFEWV